MSCPAATVREQSHDAGADVQHGRVPVLHPGRGLLKARGVKEIEKVRIDLDPARRNEMISKTGRRTVPQIYIGETHVGGFDDLSALDREGKLLPLLADHATQRRRSIAGNPRWPHTNECVQGRTGASTPFPIQRVYLKDVSLELPNSPHIFLEQEAPQVEVQLEVADERVLEGIFEVSITRDHDREGQGQGAVPRRGKQAGIFEVRNIPAEQMDAMLGVVCPGIVYPYLRANIADLITRTGLPPIHLAEINFEALYQQKMARSSRRRRRNPPRPVKRTKPRSR